MSQSIYRRRTPGSGRALFTAGIDITQNKYEAHLPEPVRAALHVEPWMLRGGLAVVVVALCWWLKPFELHGMEAVGAGLLLAAIILVIELRLAMGYHRADYWAGRLGQCWGFLRRCW